MFYNNEHIPLFFLLSFVCNFGSVGISTSIYIYKSSVLQLGYKWEFSKLKLRLFVRTFLWSPKTVLKVIEIRAIELLCNYVHSNIH